MKILRLLFALALLPPFALGQNVNLQQPAGTGYVDNEIPRRDGTGSLMQASAVMIADAASNNITIGASTSSNDITLRGGAAGATIALGRDATGAVAITAGGTNQNVTVTPSGTGQVTMAAASAGDVLDITRTTTGASGILGLFLTNAGAGAAGDGPFFGLYGKSTTTAGRLMAQVGSIWTTATDASRSSALVFWTTNAAASAERGRFAPSGNLLLGGLTTDGTGILQFPVATTSAGGISFSADTFLFRSAAGQITYNNVNGVTTRYQYNGVNTGLAGVDSSNMYLDASAAGGSLIFRSNGTTTALIIDASQNQQAVGKYTNYKSLTAEGEGVLAIRKVGRITAQTTNATICTLTTPAADASYRVSGNILITSAVAVSTSLNVDYTDESNTARTMILPLAGLAGSFVAGGLAVAAQPYESAAMHIRTKASTTITISVAAGTFTSVTYNAEGAITQLQ